MSELNAFDWLPIERLATAALERCSKGMLSVKRNFCSGALATLCLGTVIFADATASTVSASMGLEVLYLLDV